MTQPALLALEVDQLVDARPETVFRLLTEPDLYARWFGPEGAQVSVDAMDVRLGGRLGLTITFPGTDLVVGIEGFYEVVEPPTTLVHTWRVLEEELVTAVAFTLEPHGDGTRLVLTHRGFVDPLDLQTNQGGWAAHLRVLAKLAADLDRTPS
jgi:uncharacterized protein YndB with AHSA1/START domain